MVSRARVESGEGESLTAEAFPLDLPKCGRCWHREESAGKDSAHPDLCARCIRALQGDAGERKFA